MRLRSPPSFVGVRPLAASPPPVPQDRLQLCGTCHGEKGNSKMEKMPSLAGQPELFLTNQLILFRERLRKSEVMEPFVKGMTDPEIIALAQHYSRSWQPEPSARACRPGAGGPRRRVSPRRCTAAPATCPTSWVASRCRGSQASASTT